MGFADLARRLRGVVGEDGVFTERGDLIAFEYDAGFEEHAPDLVVLPRTTAEVQAVVRLANEAGVPLVPRGAGTGLCSGAVPVQGGIVIALTRMNRVLDVDVPNRRATVEPGVINLTL
ncbi:MAG TPA: FAD-binding oxidoreductase, partial [Dehalococcoidia bacterium]|nr:FAD-binding oxidoreductase [Dehalococcoidia bacterium]